MTGNTSDASAAVPLPRWPGPWPHVPDPWPHVPLKALAVRADDLFAPTHDLGALIALVSVGGAPAVGMPLLVAAIAAMTYLGLARSSGLWRAERAATKRRLAETEHRALARDLHDAVGESLANAPRHGDANALDVVLERRPGLVRLVIDDDGRGFDPERTPGDRGLGGMRARARELEGAVTIASAPGRGATVTLELPTVEAA